MTNFGELDATDAARIGSTIGRMDIAKVLFRPRLDDEAITAIANAVLGHLRVEPASVTVVANIAQLPPERAKSWATQCWVNIVGELAASDPEMEKAFREGGGYLPTAPATIMLYKQKLAEKFHCFLWIVGWRGVVGDFANCFTVRLLILDGVIRIEDLQAMLDGQPGGWGILDSVVNGALLVASATNQRIKTVATNERIEKAFRRRGFVEPQDGGKFTHTEKARPLEFRLPEST